MLRTDLVRRGRNDPLRLAYTAEIDAVDQSELSPLYLLKVIY